MDKYVGTKLYKHILYDYNHISVTECIIVKDGLNTCQVALAEDTSQIIDFFSARTIDDIENYSFYFNECEECEKSDRSYAEWWAHEKDIKKFTDMVIKELEKDKSEIENNIKILKAYQSEEG